MRKKSPLPIIEKLKITGIAAEGKAVARHGEQVVFIPFGAPGDLVDIQVTKNQKKYLEGRIIGLYDKSGWRVQPFCEHFGICGGCRWQHIDYKHQLDFKQQQVTDHFKRIGKFDIPEPDTVLPSVNTQYYRNKLEFTFTNRRWLTEDEISVPERSYEMRAAGFHIPGRFDKVLDINRCYLQRDPSNAIRVAIRDYAIEKNLEFFDLVKQQGFLRNLVIRTSSSGELMVIVVFFRNEPGLIEPLLGFVSSEFPGIDSLMYVINNKANDTISDLDVKLFRGRDHIIEEMDGLRFRMGPKSFYQTNSDQALELYRVVRDYAQPRRDELVYDLYTGTGTIAAFISSYCREVCGIEYVGEAVEDARFNAGINNLDNIRFFTGDIKDVLTSEFTSVHGLPDTIITDPPRTGMHKSVVERIADISPRRIVYVSCNSATQARDIALLDQFYRVERYRAVDMFPHTQHIESVALLVARH